MNDIHTNYLSLITQIHNNSIRQRLNSYPLPISKNLKTSNFILYQKCNCTHVRMCLQTQSKLWLRAWWIIADGNILIGFSNYILDIGRWKTNAFRYKSKQPFSKQLHLLAILLERRGIAWNDNLYQQNSIRVLRICKPIGIHSSSLNFKQPDKSRNLDIKEKFKRGRLLLLKDIPMLNSKLFLSEEAK